MFLPKPGRVRDNPRLHEVTHYARFGEGGTPKRLLVLSFENDADSYRLL